MTEEQFLGRLIHLFALFAKKVKSQLSQDLKGENVTRPRGFNFKIEAYNEAVHRKAVNPLDFTD